MTPDLPDIDLPCPFCGAPDHDIVSDNDARGSYWLACEQCGTQGPVGETYVQSIELWNRRASAETAR